jgi:hypothetical protein
MLLWLLSQCFKSFDDLLETIQIALLDPVLPMTMAMTRMVVTMALVREDLEDPLK